MSVYKKHILYAVRIAIGIVFILSGAFKLSTIPSFENLLLKLDIISWKYVEVLSRAIISFEFLIGVLLIANIYIKKTLQITLYTLIGFSFILVYLYFFVSTQDNCGCFGEIIKLNPIESIIKNLILIALVIISLKNKESIVNEWFKMHRKIILIILAIGAFAWPYIAYMPMSKNIKSNYTIKNPFYIDQETMESVNFNTQDSVNLTQGKHIICFASLTCPACKRAISKLSSIHQNNQEKLSIYIIFLDTADRDNLLEDLIAETGLTTIPYTFMPLEDFVKTSHSQLPFIVFSEDGEAKDLRNYSDLHINNIFSFFSK